MTRGMSLAALINFFSKKDLIKTLFQKLERN